MRKPTNDTQVTSDIPSHYGGPYLSHRVPDLVSRQVGSLGKRAHWSERAMVDSAGRISLPEGLGKLAGKSTLDARRQVKRGIRMRANAANAADEVESTADFTTKCVTQTSNNNTGKDKQETDRSRKE